MEAWERDRAVPRELWKKMGEQGFLCPWLPEAYGGLDLDFSYSIIIGEELIRADGFGVGVPLHSDVAVPYIFSYGSEEVKKKILPGCTTGEIITCIGLTEPNAGSDLAAIRTKAIRRVITTSSTVRRPLSPMVSLPRRWCWRCGSSLPTSDRGGSVW